MALTAQFNAYEVALGAHVNGAFTLSANIADVGGLAVALSGDVPCVLP
jgi:predicted metalloendopeptidase